MGRTSRQRLAHSSACAADGEFGTVSSHARRRRVSLGRTPSLGRLRPRESHPRLFACVVGTTSSSDFLFAFMSALPSETFSDRYTPGGWKQTGSPGSRAWSFQACTGSSTPPCRDTTCHGAMSRVAFPQTPQGRHTKVLISELNSWPACTSGRCYTHDVTVAGVRFEAEMTG